MSLLTLFPSWHRFCSVEVGACDDSVLERSSCDVGKQGARDGQADRLRGQVEGLGVHDASYRSTGVAAS